MDDYYVAEHEDVALLIMKDTSVVTGIPSPSARDGYVNATKLCVHAGKNIASWIRYNHALVDEYTTRTGAPAKIIIGTGARETHGTYLHPEIIPHIALWISPSHAFAVNRIIEEYTIFKREQEYAQLPWSVKILIKSYVMFT